MDVLCLIDFDNMPVQIRNGGLGAFANKLLVNISGTIASFQDVRVRLYGGWYSQGGLSNSGSRLTQEISRIFPIAIAVQGQIVHRIHCEIASSLVDNRAHVLGWTHRQRHGIRSVLARKSPPLCASQGACVIDAVVSWSRGACPIAGCSVKVKDAFAYGEQKLVDTLLCCDVLALSLRRPSPPIFVLSDDDDLMPAYVMAGGLGASVWRCRMGSNTNTFYDGLLAQSGVGTITI